MTAFYDIIGVDYSDLRKPDPRIAKVIGDALGSAETVLNVGAGSGSYEPAGRQVTAVEPSAEMIRQRVEFAAPAVRATAELLPFNDNAFEASLAVNTIHHWTDKKKGLQEMRRVTRGRVVLLTFDVAYRGAWLMDYVPELVTLDEGNMPQMDFYEKWIGPVDISPICVPHDCIDGFLYAYWRRPAAYLDSTIRRVMSPFRMIDNISEQLERLADDLETGEWEKRYGDLLTRDEFDVGYRLVVTK